MTRAARTVRDAAAGRLFALMLGIFMLGGLLASVEALLVPRLKLALGLDYAAALTIQLAYYASYLLFAFPATMLAARAGAMRASALGLVLMATGCALVAAALAAQGFAATLVALLLVSAGATVLQIACNGMMATQGARDRATARFTTLQGFNALGTVLGPLAAAPFLLGAGTGFAPLIPFLAFAGGFALLAGLTFAARNLLPREAGDASPRAERLLALLRERRTVLGALAIFAYVGAEVTIGTLLVTYLMQPDRGGLGPVDAARLTGLYWGGAMLGRFAGGWALRRIAPWTLLGAAALAAAMLVATALLPSGYMGGAALVAVGLANSIMFPVIFALAMPPRADDVPAASMLLCMAVVGGAVIPFITGLVADRTTLSLSLIVPLLCYCTIWGFSRLPHASGAARA